MLITMEQAEIQRLEAKISKAQADFALTKYASLVDKALILFYQEEFKESEKLINSLPTADDLLNKLVLKLKHKSVFKSIALIQKGKAENNATYLKVLFSLGTHAAIEIEKGNREYKILIALLYDKLGEVIYRSE